MKRTFRSVEIEENASSFSTWIKRERAFIVSRSKVELKFFPSRLKSCSFKEIVDFCRIRLKSLPDFEDFGNRRNVATSYFDKNDKFLIFTLVSNGFFCYNQTVDD